MGVFGVLVLAALLGLIPAKIASDKGRSFGGWWVYGFLLFIVALIHALAMARSQAGLDRRASGDGLVKCPSCAEWVKQEAKVCRFCGRDMPAAAPKPAGADFIPETF